MAAFCFLLWGEWGRRAAQYVPTVVVPFTLRSVFLCKPRHPWTC